MSAMKIKKGDMVKVIAGKDKDKEGKVISATTGYENGAINTLMKQIDKALK